MITSLEFPFLHKKVVFFTFLQNFVNTNKSVMQKSSRNWKNGSSLNDISSTSNRYCKNSGFDLLQRITDANLPGVCSFELLLKPENFRFELVFLVSIFYGYHLSFLHFCLGFPDLEVWCTNPSITYKQLFQSYLRFSFSGFRFEFFSSLSNPLAVSFNDLEFPVRVFVFYIGFEKHQKLIFT